MDQKIIDSLATFGLNELETKIFVALTKHPSLTVLQLARIMEVKRTNLYRLLDNLKARGLIVELVDDKTTYYSAADSHAFKNHVQTLEKSASFIEDWLKSVTQSQKGSTAVKFYRGVAGLQYLEWQKCEVPHSEILILDSSQWHQRLSREFAESIRAEMVAKDIHVREICNPARNATEWTDNKIFQEKHYQFKTIDPKMLNLKQDIYIFQDHIQLQSYADDDIVGIDLHSPVYAALFTQIFEILWGIAHTPNKS